MAQADLALMAHLMRRAGFGTTREELERYAAQGYEATVEELLSTHDKPYELEDEDLIRRYHIERNSFSNCGDCASYWLYRMINTKRPFEEKLALFWHGVFATGDAKIDNPRKILNQIEMFRRAGMGSFQTLLVHLSKDPAMIFWLDNKDNHGEAVNENYGREILELFSMGVGNYTEVDVRECSRAFTGWTMRNAQLHTVIESIGSVWPYGRLEWQFEYDDQDHDHGEKTFLGHTGSFNGEDVIDIVCRQPATARFIARHLYSFFVADEAQVPAWNTVPPRNPEAIQTLADAYFKYEYDIRSVLRVLFNSDFFKESRFARVKSPAELVVGTARLSGGYRTPHLEDRYLNAVTSYMGQKLLDPPSVEGWHTGSEWITSGSLVQRVNFATSEFSDVSKPGVRDIIERIKALGPRLSPDQAADACLDMLGPISDAHAVRGELIAHASAGGDIRFGSETQNQESAERIKGLLQLLVASREYQYA
jgi:uncharacterized protein (DUF1800 family)